MDVHPSSHPTGQTLRSFGLGKLDDRSAEAVNNHLERCPGCRQRVAELSADSFLGRIRDAQPMGEHAFSQSRASATDRLTGPVTQAPEPASKLPPGLADQPDYEIKRELGRGGMGVVYLAHNRLMGRDDALKVMGRHIIERPRVLERFLREIRAVARLRHPNIVAAYNATWLGQNIVLAMEYVEGLDLARTVGASGPLPVAHACNFIYQAALGLQHAHEECLVHRDVKPSNLMLSSKGGKYTVKILDFGLAKATREEKLDGALTGEGQALGTPDFIAPEQIVNAPGVDIRADVYSLGGTFYYLLTGRAPFQESCLYDLYQAHISREVRPLNLVRPEVPAELAALVAKMMAKSPDRRFQTPGEVAQALMPFFMGARPAFQAATPDISLDDKSAASRLTMSTASAPAQLQTTPDMPVVLLEQAANAVVSETRWDHLIAIQGTARLADTRSAIVPEGRPSCAILVLAGGLLALALSTAWLSDSLNVVSTGSVKRSENKPRGSARSPDPQGAQASLPRAHRLNSLAPPHNSGERGAQVGGKSRNESGGSGHSDEQEKPAIDRYVPTAMPVAATGPPAGSDGTEHDPETAGSEGGHRLLEPIADLVRTLFDKPRPTETNAVRTRSRPEPMPLETAESRLDAAKASYERAKDRARKKLLEDFEIAIRKVNSQRTISAVARGTLRAQLAKEREEFSKDLRMLPNTTPMHKPVIDYLASIVIARVPLTTAYENLVALYERADKFKASQLALEADKLERELGEAQPLDKNSLWEGSLSSGVRVVMPFSLRVTERRETGFAAEVVVNGGAVKAPASGRFDGLEINAYMGPILNDGALAHLNFSGIVWRGRLVALYEWRSTDEWGDSVLTERGQVELELKR